MLPRDGGKGECYSVVCGWGLWAGSGDMSAWMGMSWFDGHGSGRDQWKRGKGWWRMLWRSCQRSLKLFHQICTGAAWTEGIVPSGDSSSFHDLLLYLKVELFVNCDKVHSLLDNILPKMTR